MIASTAPAQPPASSSRRLIDAKEVGRMLGCSWRQIYRFADEGTLPWGYKIGRLRRWDLSEIESWIANGCKNADRKRGN